VTPATLALPAACFGAAALSLAGLARFGWVRTCRATHLALAILLGFTYWQAAGAGDMRGLGLTVTATLMILPALTGALAGAVLGTRLRARRMHRDPTRSAQDDRR
jgi:hypothetical protein